ncbi:vegetative cell wall protein gp1 [Stagonosporopsis vannaccii]|nr:vegetative cell wall protein gp1 [Stagonosporopsis vannaccii]
MNSAEQSAAILPGGIPPSHHSSQQSATAAKSRKRKIPPTFDTLVNRATFPRKRSVTACQLCRARKTKCNNDRPICSKCNELHAQCIYDEDESNSASAAPASQIIDRLEYLINLVETGPSSWDGRRASRDGCRNTQRCEPLPDDTESEAHHTYFGSGQDVLDWPIFEGKYDRRWIEALIFDPTLPCNDLSLNEPCTSPRVTDDSIRDIFVDPRQASGLGVGVREDDVPHLVETFLVNVHVKNPIFDPEYLRKMAKDVAEHGFDWKPSSCLVLFVCALASISSRFARRATWIPESSLHGSENSLSCTPGYQTAESYYTAACKRLGLLKNTLIATECYFVAGVYEMYSLRPLQAAISFNRACVTFQTLTWMRSEYYATEDQLGKARASRLYWSCLKSEHETSIEIRFPSSGLTKLNYTSHFPAPPLATTSEDFYRMHSDFDLDLESTSPARIHSEFEEGWYYYLADIAARRILQRVISSSYDAGESAWLNRPLQTLFQTAEELDRQLLEWHRTLPEIISFDQDVTADTELSYHLQARALEIRERIYRPFLFRSIHRPEHVTEDQTTSQFVRLHASICAQLIHHWDVRHRHHGTWLMARQSFTSALLLVAAQRSGIREADEASCERSIQHTLATLRFWEAEAPDLKASRLILEDVSSQLRVAHGSA